MVLGFGNTAADMATELAPIAGQVYLAHRHGAIIVGPAFIRSQILVINADICKNITRS